MVRIIVRHCRPAAVSTVLAFLLLAVALHGGASGKVLDLEECISITLANNPSIGIFEEEFKKSESNLLYNYGMLLPRFSLDFSTGHQFYGPSKSVQFDAQGRPVQNDGFDYENYSFRLSSDIQLFDGGGTINGIRSAMSGRDAARENLRYNKDLIAAQVIRAYYNLVRNKMLHRVQEESMDQAQRNLERSEALLEVGSATRADVLRARVLFSNTKLNMITTRNGMELARVDLANLLNIEDDGTIDVDTTLVIDVIRPDQESEIALAMEQRSDLKGLHFNLDAARASVSQAKSGYMPTFGASFGYIWNDREMAENLNFFKQEYTWSILGYISINIFDRFGTASSVGRAKADYRIAEYRLERAKLNATTEIKSLVFTINQASERIGVASETVEQAQEDLRLAQERYRVGAGTMLEVVQSQVALTQAKADVIDAKCDFLIATADLKVATGRRI